jgi:hypothetical protein
MYIVLVFPCGAWVSDSVHLLSILPGPVSVSPCQCVHQCGGVDRPWRFGITYVVDMLQLTRLVVTCWQHVAETFVNSVFSVTITWMVTRHTRLLCEVHPMDTVVHMLSTGCTHVTSAESNWPQYSHRLCNVVRGQGGNLGYTSLTLTSWNHAHEHGIIKWTVNTRKIYGMWVLTHTFKLILMFT